MSDDAKRPVAIRAADVPPRAFRTNYPEPFASRMAGRDKRPLGDLFGLANFGVNITRLKPGGSSSIRHAHTKQDEFVYILEGEPTLVTNAGRTALKPGMCAGFKGEAATPITWSTKPIRTSSISRLAIAPTATRSPIPTMTSRSSRSTAGGGWPIRTERLTERLISEAWASATTERRLPAGR